MSVLLCLSHLQSQFRLWNIRTLLRQEDTLWRKCAAPQGFHTSLQEVGIRFKYAPEEQALLSDCWDCKGIPPWHFPFLFFLVKGKCHRFTARYQSVYFIHRKRGPGIQHLLLSAE